MVVLHKKFEVKVIDIRTPQFHRIKRWVLTETSGVADEPGDVFVQGMPPAEICVTGTTYEGTLTIPEQEPANA